MDIQGRLMQRSRPVIPLPDFRSNEDKVIRPIEPDRNFVAITQNRQARAILQDFATFVHTEQSLQTYALLNILALSNEQLVNGQVKPFDTVIQRLKDQPHHPHSAMTAGTVMGSDSVNPRNHS